jgi:hypothetical protein
VPLGLVEVPEALAVAVVADQVLRQLMALLAALAALALVAVVMEVLEVLAGAAVLPMSRSQVVVVVWVVEAEEE